MALITWATLDKTLNPCESNFPPLSNQKKKKEEKMGEVVISILPNHGHSKSNDIMYKIITQI